MAKGKRQIIHLVCTQCREQNYTTTKNKQNTPDKLERKKFCPRCQEQTLHKESSKLK